MWSLMTPSVRSVLLATGLALSTVGVATTPAISPAAFPGNNGYIVTSMDAGPATNNVIMQWVRNGSHWVNHNLTYTSNKQDTSPSYSADGKLIVFVRNGDIFTVTNAGKAQRLTRTSADDEGPTFTPGGRIVWTAGKQLRKMTANGSGQTGLGIAGRDASVSPNGTWVAYTHYSSLKAADHIFKAHLDGSHVTDVTPRATNDEANPDWSPDGARLVFQQIDPRTQRFRLVVVRADGSNRTELARDPNADLTHPAYSPNGTKLAFQREPTTATPSIYILDLATMQQTLALTDGGSYGVTDPTWQPA